ncbi:hypothetical protein [Streptomyces rochei]|uniref:hypothetical protein n=1 Tax=Streptomyces rochei TaxID=1928 RepID=UPI0013B62AC6|nr:hypothetical protein [Streptomyces rochei]NEC76772.1 hypothetical protein [Streptomyces rochei]
MTTPPEDFLFDVAAPPTPVERLLLLADQYVQHNDMLDRLLRAHPPSEPNAHVEQHGFVPTADGASYRTRDGLDERQLLSAVTAAEAHAYTHGLSARVHLGIPTPADIPASARRRSAPATGPRTTPSVPRRTR